MRNNITIGSIFSQYSDSLMHLVRTSRPDKYEHAVSLLMDMQLLDFRAANESKDFYSGFSEWAYKYTDTPMPLSAIIVPSLDHDFKFNLPFWSSFILLEQKDTCYKAIQLEEREPQKYYGTLVYNQPKFSTGTGFVIEQNDGYCVFYFTLDPKIFSSDPFRESVSRQFTRDLIVVDKIFSEISDRYYAREDNGTKSFYIRSRKKKAPATKVAEKPVFIFLGKKDAYGRSVSRAQKKHPQYKISSSFPVMGHWRKLHSMNSIGKDRQGNYNQLGFTWVKSYTKGARDLTNKRPYIVIPTQSSK